MGEEKKGEEACLVGDRRPLLLLLLLLLPETMMMVRVEIDFCIYVRTSIGKEREAIRIRFMPLLLGGNKIFINASWVFQQDFLLSLAFFLCTSSISFTVLLGHTYKPPPPPQGLRLTFRKEPLNTLTPFSNQDRSKQPSLYRALT